MDEGEHLRRRRVRANRASRADGPPADSEPTPEADGTPAPDTVAGTPAAPTRRRADPSRRAAPPPEAPPLHVESPAAPAHVESGSTSVESGSAPASGESRESPDRGADAGFAPADDARGVGAGADGGDRPGGPAARRPTEPRPRGERPAPEPYDVHTPVGGDDRDGERGLRGLVGGGSSQVGIVAAMRARDASRPTDADIAAAEASLTIVHRGWVPRDP